MNLVTPDLGPFAAAVQRWWTAQHDHPSSESIHWMFRNVAGLGADGRTAARSRSWARAFARTSRRLLSMPPDNCGNLTRRSHDK